MEQSKLNLEYVYHRGKNKTLVVICNGHGATLEHPSVKKFMAELLRKGFSSICFDYSNISIIQMVKDTEKVINYFSQYKNIYITAFSLGAVPAVITSIINPRVNSLITINGFFGKTNIALKDKIIYAAYRLRTLISYKYHNDYKFFKENFIPEKLKLPVLVIYTKADKIVSPSQSIDFFNRLNSSKKKKLAELPLFKHNLRGEGDVERTVEEIFRWEATSTPKR